MGGRGTDDVSLGSRGEELDCLAKSATRGNILGFLTGESVIEKQDVNPETRELTLRPEHESILFYRFALAKTYAHWMEISQGSLEAET